MTGQIIHFHAKSGFLIFLVLSGSPLCGGEMLMTRPVERCSGRAM